MEDVTEAIKLVKKRRNAKKRLSEVFSDELVGKLLDAVASDRAYHYTWLIGTNLTEILEWHILGGTEKE